MMTTASETTTLTIPGLTLTPKGFFSVTDVSKIVRKLLAQTFPGITFSVTSDKYSMGSSVRIRWTDGPTEQQVNQTVSPLYQRGFDGMTDSTYYTSPCTINGVVVSTSSFITTSRFSSPAMVEFAKQNWTFHEREDLNRWEPYYPFMHRLEVKDGQYILHPYSYSDEPVVVVGSVAK